MPPGGQQLGLLLALAALVCGSAGALLSRAALRDSALPPLQSATLRLAAAAIVMLPLLWRLPPPGVRPRPLRRRWPLVLLATLLGTSAGIVLQQTALQHLPAGLLVCKKVEAATGFEPVDEGFADLCLTTWPRRQKKNGAGNGI